MSNNTSWISVTGGSSGSGSGTVSYNVHREPGDQFAPGDADDRRADADCESERCGSVQFHARPTSQNVVAAGGAQTVTVTTTSAVRVDSSEQCELDNTHERQRDR